MSAVSTAILELSLILMLCKVIYNNSLGAPESDIIINYEFYSNGRVLIGIRHLGPTTKLCQVPSIQR
jgi:hypothetical protein